MFRTTLILVGLSTAGVLGFSLWLGDLGRIDTSEELREALVDAAIAVQVYSPDAMDEKTIPPCDSCLVWPY